jgi:hypothetical protein
MGATSCLFYRIDYRLHIAFPECGPGSFSDAEVRDQDVPVNGKTFVVHNLLCARNRAAVNDYTFIRGFPHANKFLNASADSGKARAAAISLSGKPAGCRIRQLADV